MKPKDLPLFREPKAKKTLNESCERHRITLSLLQELLEVQRKYYGSGRQAGITSDFDSILGDFVDDAGGQ